MCDEIFAVFEGVCLDCGAEIANVRVECHPNRVQDWSDDVPVTTNDRMAANYASHMPDDWISSRLAIYQCECSRCERKFYLEQNIFGDWVA